MICRVKKLYTLKFGNVRINIKCVLKDEKIFIWTFNHVNQQKKIKKSPQYKIKNTSVCGILRQHSNELQNDPERLSTEWMLSIIKDNRIDE